jgi:hypothetical protein
VGFACYLAGGLLFAVLYAWIFRVVGVAGWWFGALLGLAHAVFLLAVILPLLPMCHPRMVAEYDPPAAAPRLEPPGFMGIHYGRRTPAVAVAAHVVYGAILGLGFA